MLQKPYTRIPWDRLKRRLGKVEKPARYVGGEINAVLKNPEDVRVHFALAFPDAYEVGASHLGSQILYYILNKETDVSCERVFAPWPDMEQVLRQEGWPLYALESKTPLYAFDIVGFSLQYELTYTNLLSMLDLGGIPLKTADRDESYPLILAGGPNAMSPEPLADFVDVFALGDGEELVLDIVRAYQSWRESSGTKLELLQALSQIDGVYVPSLYQVRYDRDGTIVSVTPVKSQGFTAPGVVTRRVLETLEGAAYPVDPVIPLMAPIHDRAVVEIFRGCTQGCRFCQAGVLYRPVRERDPETVLRLSNDILERTGLGEVSMSSLSSADYSHIQQVVSQLVENQCGKKVSLPSLRVDSFSVDLAESLGFSKKSGLTLAPEAGSQRMRDVINKRVTEDEILNAAGHAFSSGYSHIKLYFMIGLPSETHEDVMEIAILAQKIRQVGRDMGVRPTVVVSVSGFVPKAHTPFQWESCNLPEEIEQKQKLLRKHLRGPGLEFRYHDPKVTKLEAVFARGDRRLGKVMELAYKNGARFDSWSDWFRPGVWQEAFSEAGVDAHFYAHRTRGHEEILPWDHLHSGVRKSYLWQESVNAQKVAVTPDCRLGCTGCGICPDLGVEMLLYTPNLKPKSEGTLS